MKMHHFKALNFKKKFSGRAEPPDPPLINNDDYKPHYIPCMQVSLVYY